MVNYRSKCYSLWIEPKRCRVDVKLVLVGFAPAPDPELEGFVVACVILLDGWAAGCDFLPLRGIA
jgi:hypothetical protein